MSWIACEGTGGTEQTRTVLFVCAHGAGRSRLAAALFNADPPPGWWATTAAAEEAAAAVNPNVAPLLAALPAGAHVDQTPPRPADEGPAADLVIAIDCDRPGAPRWNLRNTVVDAAMRDELRDRVAGLARSLAGREETRPPP
jgi:protein-tyrosine-phosphatase